jgi:two-component system nitrogen regulation response regulator NtrX
MKRRILVVDDEKNIRRTLGMVLRSEGFEVNEAASGEEGLRVLAETGADLVLLDVNLPGIDGLEMLRRIKRNDPDRMVVMISGEGTVAVALEATREGAFDFLEKPLTKERVLVAVRNALDLDTMGREFRELKARETDRHTMIGESEPIRKVREEIARAGPSTARVLILGASGTGKELIARAIHEASDRAAGPFVKVNCAAIPEELIESELFGATKGAYTGADASRDGKFLQADGGTLFLDEIGDMSLKAQAKVLRSLQEGEIERVGGSGTIRVDVRVLAATNKDLAVEVGEGRFREDLYFRLNVVPIVAPALRDRRDDIPRLAHHFLERFLRENNRPPLTFSAEAIRALSGSAWPGNVRELENAVERLAIMARGTEIGLGDLARAGLGTDARPAEGAGTPPASEGGPGEFRQREGAPAVPGRSAPSPARPPAGGIPAVSPEEIQRVGGLVEARRRFETACIREALTAAAGNVSAAARLLGIDRTNLHKKIQSYGIETTDPPEPGVRS